MDWTAVGALGELIGAMAVVASLVYVGRQMRLTARSAAIQGVETLTSVYAQFGFTVAASPELSDLMFRVQYKGIRPDDLTEAQRGQVGYLFHSVLMIQVTMWERWRRGAIDREMHDSYLGRTAAMFATPYFAEVWPFLRDNFPEEFAAFVDERRDPPSFGHQSVPEGEGGSDPETRAMD